MKIFRHVLATFLLALLVLAGAPPARADINQWSGSGPFATGLGNSVINALAVSPDGLTVYAGTASGTVFSYTLVTSPTVSTGAATGITTVSATLHGMVKANNADASTSFEYGLTAAYGSSIAATPALVTGNTPTAVTAAVGGLLPGAIYHFRISATNSAGTSNGLDATFTTNSIVPANTPSVSGLSPTNNARPTWSWISGGGGGIGDYQYNLDNSGWNSTTATTFTPLSGLSSGPHILFVQEQDAGGNWSLSGVKTIAVDLDNPILAVSTLPSGVVTNNRVLNITGSAADALGLAMVTITLNSSPTETIATNFNRAEILQSGVNTLVVTAIDSVGNAVVDTRTITFDQTAPLLTVTAPTDNSVEVGDVIDVTGTIEEGTIVDVSINNAAPNPAIVSDQTFTATVALAAGLNTIEITATEPGGKTNTMKRTVFSDSQGATLRVSQPGEDSVTNQQSMIFRGTVADAPDGAYVTIEADGQIYHPVLNNGVFEQMVLFSTPATYPVNVTVKDSAGNVISIVQRNLIYKLLNVTLVSDKISPQTLPGAGTITFTAQASEGTGMYEYKFWLKTGGVWHMMRDYSTTSTWTWNTAGAAAGSYGVQVYVRNIGSSAKYEAVKTVNYMLIYPPTSDATLTPDVLSPQAVGNDITFTAGGIGGSGNYEYKFWFKTAGTWTTVQNYSSTNTWTWHTTGTPAGTYGVQVYVRNIGSSAMYEATKFMSYGLIYGPATGATISPNVASPQTAGAHVTFTAGGIGGSGNYEYKFWIKAAGVWTSVQGFSTTNTWVWDTTGLPPGTYRAQVYVRNVGSSAKYEAVLGMGYVIK